MFTCYQMRFCAVSSTVPQNKFILCLGRGRNISWLIILPFLYTVFISGPKLVKLNKMSHVIAMKNRCKFAQNQEPPFSGSDH